MNATYNLSPDALPKAWINVIRESAKAAESDRYHTVVEDNVEMPAVVCERCGAQLVAVGPLRESEQGNYMRQSECAVCQQRHVVGSMQIAPGVKVWMSRSTYPGDPRPPCCPQSDWCKPLRHQQRRS